MGESFAEMFEQSLGRDKMRPGAIVTGKIGRAHV